MKQNIKQAGERVYLLLYGIDRENDQQYTEWRADLEVAIFDLVDAHKEKERKEILQIIKDSEWECPIHERVDPVINKGCEDCKEAAGINVILFDLYKAILSRQKEWEKRKRRLEKFKSRK